MPAVSPNLHFHGFPTLFGHVKDTNITFVVDTSQSMQLHLSAIKFHLKEALLAKAYTTLSSRFNIVEFSNKVTKWCDHVVTCTPQTVFSAVQWLQSLTCTLGRDLLSALTAAFDDPMCQAIYLVTTGLPDNTLKDIFHALPYLSRGRPLHTFYLSDKWIDSESRDFLQRISMLTQGSAHLIRLSHCGAIEQVIPIYPEDRSISGPLYSAPKYCSVKTPLDKSPWEECSDAEALHMHSANFYDPRKSASFCKYTDPWAGHLRSSHLVFGTSVLARQESDGFFYLGKIKQEIRKGIFLIEFDKSTMDQNDKCQIFVQKTALPDIIQCNEGMRHAVVPGDNVLAPWESDRVRYGPGVVVFGIETRDPLQAMEDDEISVKFWNAKTVNVSKNVAMWIPSAMYKRVLQELLTPLSSRHQLMDNEFTSCRDVYLHGPHVSELAHQCHFEPMCTQSSFSNFPGLDPYHNYWNGFYHGFHCLPVCPPCCCFQEVIPPAGWWPVTPKYINSTTCDKDALDKKVTLQLQELDVPKNKFSEKLLSSPSSASSSEDSDSSLETTVCKPTLEHKGVNSDSLLERSRSKGRGRPEWRYWSQSHQKTHGKKPETSSSPLRGASDSSHLKSSVQLQNLGPTNRCAMFESVDHASSQNRVTMKDVLTYQKHHITSSTGVQCPPIQERLGESQLSHDHQHQEATQRSRMKKLQRRLWEKEREHQCENKYQTIQEKRRYISV